MDSESVRKLTLVQIKVLARRLRVDTEITDEWLNGLSPQDLVEVRDALDHLARSAGGTKGD